MRAIEILKDEHRQIERVLLALATEVIRVREGAPADPAFFEQAADFIQVYADGSHHAKEEGVLFEVLHQHGLPKDVGPLHCMLREHDMGRRLTVAMGSAARGLKQGRSEMRDAMLEAAAQYSQLLAMHIQKEDNGLFMLAEQRLSPEALDQALARYEGLGRPYEEMVAAASALERPEAEPADPSWLTAGD